MLATRKWMKKEWAQLSVRKGTAYVMWYTHHTNRMSSPWALACFDQNKGIMQLLQEVFNCEYKLIMVWHRLPR
jgi:hypothetical protein